MILEGDTSVIDALKEKKRLMDAGAKHEHIKIKLVCGGGCLKAAYSWGTILAFADLGYEQCFSIVAGNSSGALAAAYLLSGNVREVESLVIEEAVSKSFFNLWRPFNILGTRYMRSVLEDDPHRRLNIDRVLSHPSRFMIGLSEYETARPFVIEPRNTEEVLESLRATVSMAGAVSDPVYIRGVRYIDGETTIPYVRKELYGKGDCTHILDITNQEIDEPTYNLGEAILLPTLYRFKTNRLVRQAALGRFKNRKDFLQTIADESLRPVCLMYGDDSVGSLEADRRKLQQAVDRSRSFWHNLLQ